MVNIDFFKEPEERILRLTDVINITGLKKTTIYKKMQEGSFPPSIQLGARSVGWRISKIMQWIDECEVCDGK